MMSLLGGEGGKLKGGGGSAYPYYLLNLGYVTGVSGPWDTDSGIPIKFGIGPGDSRPPGYVGRRLRYR